MAKTGSSTENELLVNLKGDLPDVKLTTTFDNPPPVKDEKTAILPSLIDFFPHSTTRIPPVPILVPTPVQAPPFTSESPDVGPTPVQDDAKAFPPAMTMVVPEIVPFPVPDETPPALATPTRKPKTTKADHPAMETMVPDVNPTTTPNPNDTIGLFTEPAIKLSDDARIPGRDEMPPFPVPDVVPIPTSTLIETSAFPATVTPTPLQFTKDTDTSTVATRFPDMAPPPAWTPGPIATPDVAVLNVTEPIPTITPTVPTPVQILQDKTVPETVVPSFGEVGRESPGIEFPTTSGLPNLFDSPEKKEPEIALPRTQDVPTPVPSNVEEEIRIEAEAPDGILPVRAVEDPIIGILNIPRLIAKVVTEDEPVESSTDVLPTAVSEPTPTEETSITNVPSPDVLPTTVPEPTPTPTPIPIPTEESSDTEVPEILPTTVPEPTPTEESSIETELPDILPTTVPEPTPTEESIIHTVLPDILPTTVPLSGDIGTTLPTPEVGTSTPPAVEKPREIDGSLNPIVQNIPKPTLPNIRFGGDHNKVIQDGDTLITDPVTQLPGPMAPSLSVPLVSDQTNYSKVSDVSNFHDATGAGICGGIVITALMVVVLVIYRRRRKRRKIIDIEGANSTFDMRDVKDLQKVESGSDECPVLQVLPRDNVEAPPNRNSRRISPALSVVVIPEMLLPDLDFPEFFTPTVRTPKSGRSDIVPVEEKGYW